MDLKRDGCDLGALWTQVLLKAWRLHQRALISLSCSPPAHEQGRNAEQLVANA